MKLLSCYITGFGKFCDFEMKFEDFNVIHNPNGWGKTTLCHFIKAMLFGLSDKKSKNINENERAKYTPFSGGKYGGTLDIEENKKKYRIERFFGTTASKDSFTLYDLSTNKESKAFSSKIGEEITGINGDAFAKCLYLPQNKNAVESDGSLSAKLSGLIQDENDVNNYANALKILDNQRQIYVKQGSKVAAEKGSRGLIEATQTAIDIKRREIDSAVNDARTINHSERELSALTNRIDGLKGEVEKTNGEIRRLEKEKDSYYLYKEYKKTEAENAKIKAEYDSILAELNGSVLPEKEIEKYRATERQIVEQKAKISLLNEQQKSTGNAPKKGLRKGLLIISAILFALCLGLGIFTVATGAEVFIPILCFAVSAVWAIVFCVFFFKKSSSVTNVSGVADLVKDADKAEKSLNDFLRNYNANSLLEIEKRCMEAEKLSQKVDESNATLQNFIKENKVPQLPPAYDEIKIAELHTSVDALNAELAADSQKIGALKTSLDLLQSSSVSVSVLQSELDKLIEDKALYTEKLNIINNAKSYLEKAHDSLNSNYLPKVVDNFNHYVKLIGSSVSMSIDSSLQVRFIDRGEKQLREYLSSGYNDIIDVCVRLALADCMFKNNHFLLLDDPFTELDDDKISKGLNMLKALAKTRQIIYTTCHKSRTFAKK